MTGITSTGLHDVERPRGEALAHCRACDGALRFLRDARGMLHEACEADDITPTGERRQFRTIRYVPEPHALEHEHLT